MKKLIFLALVATVVCISSCSKEGDGGGNSNGLDSLVHFMWISLLMVFSPITSLMESSARLSRP